MKKSSLKFAATSMLAALAISLMPGNAPAQTVLYQETFGVPTTPDQSVTNVGWNSDFSTGSKLRIFNSASTGVVFPRCAVYTSDSAGSLDSYYATTASANGGPYVGGTISNKMALPSIDLSSVSNLQFTVDWNVQNGTSGGTWNAFFEVQINHGQWYVSTNNPLSPQPVNTTFVTPVFTFDPAATNWNVMTNSGNGIHYGSFNAANPYPRIGPAATSNLTGNITGVGIVIRHITFGNPQFDNFTVLGTLPPTTLPVISSPPFSVTNYTGTAATFGVGATTNGTT